MERVEGLRFFSWGLFPEGLGVLGFGVKGVGQQKTLAQLQGEVTRNCTTTARLPVPHDPFSEHETLQNPLK